MADVTEPLDGSDSDSDRRLPDLFVGAVDEVAIFALAPSEATDRVRWSAMEGGQAHEAAVVLAAEGIQARTRQWSDGQQRVWVTPGEGYRARDVIKEWCARQAYEVANIRVEPDVPFRDVDSIPGGLFPAMVAAAVEWLYPRTSGIRRRLVAELDDIDEGDVRSMMYLFVSDHADRYTDRDGRLGRVNFLTYLLGKMRTWPQDAARAAYGRNPVNDRLAIRQGVEQLTAQWQRQPTEVELADHLGLSVTDLRQRESAVRSMDRLRLAESIEEFADLPTEGGVDPGGAPSRAERAVLTAALIDAVAAGQSDPLGLAVSYLVFWEGLTRAEAARALDILPKSASAAVSRTVSGMPKDDLS